VTDLAPALIRWEHPGTADEGLPPLAPQPASGARLAREVAVFLSVAIVFVLIFRAFVAQVFWIPSGSMIPQLAVNDRVLVSKISYRLHDPHRGDIVVFPEPELARVGLGPVRRPNLIVRGLRALGEGLAVVHPSTDDYIKRIVGLPGDTVEGRGGHVFVNGVLLKEPYLPPGTFTSDFGPKFVEPGRLWVMGDNRSNSSDSRFFDTIPASSVVGRAVLKIWPPPSASFL
jgi:signal peptidase I